MPPPTLLLAFVVALTATTTLPLTSPGDKDIKPELPFETVPFMRGDKTMARHAIGVVRPAITLKSVTVSATAAIAFVADITDWVASTLTTSVLKERVVRFTPLILTLNGVTVLLKMTPLTSKGR